MYEDCPQRFLWSCGWEGIDLGNGPGKRKTTPGEKDQYHALLGTVVQRTLEDFYNQKMWKNLSTLERDLKDKVKYYFDDKKDRFVLGKFSPSAHELILEGQKSVRNFLVTAKAHALISKTSRSEEKIIVEYKGIKLGAKIDFIIPKKESLYLLDGKNTKYRMKYMKPDQLRFYSMVYETKYQKKPDKLGYVWYRFPYNEETGDQGLDFISCTKRDEDSLWERIQDAKKSLLREEFPANPVPKVCRFCDFESVCPERQEQRKENAAKRKSKKSLPVLPSGVFSMGE
jgi:hypothetical protein